MVTLYGLTWWSKEWLQALTNIDFTNRLPRGKTYANKGAVLEAYLNHENNILARVIGSRPKPYSQEIIFTKFTSDQIDQILDLIKKNPFYQARLTTNQLPSQLSQELDKRQIQLFPRSWDEVEARCSCPDWAIPCKHLAAVFYQVSRLIDTDPFLVFKLKGLDLVSKIEEMGFKTKHTSTTQFNSLAQFLKQPKQGPVTDIEFLAFELPKLEDVNSSLSILFRPQPVFYNQKDFQQILIKTLYDPKTKQKTLGKIGNFFTSSLDKRIESVKKTKTFEEAPKIQIYSDLQIVLDADLKLISLKFTQNQQLKEVRFVDSNEFLDWLEHLTTLDLHKTDLGFQGLGYLWLLLKQVFTQGHFVPAVWKYDLFEPTNYQVFWSRLDFDPVLSGAFIKLETFFAQPVVSINPREVATKPIESSASKSRDVRFKTKNNKPINIDFHLASSVQIQLLSQIILSLLNNANSKTLALNRDQVNDFFFRGASLETVDLNNLVTPIGLWLPRFESLQSDFSLKVQVDEVGDDFELSLMVVSGDKTAQSLAKVLHKSNAEIYQPILERLTLLSDFYPDLGTLVASLGREQLIYDTAKFLEILLQILPILRLLHLEVVLPKSLMKLIRPRAIVKANKTGSRLSFLSLESMLTFDWQIALGDKNLTLEEFKKLVKGQHGLVKIASEYVIIEQDDLQKLEAQLQTSPKIGSLEAMEILFNSTLGGQTLILDDELKQTIDHFRQVSEISQVETTQAKLRAYQQTGLAWLYKNCQLGIGSLIADDMGLGKTVQVICLLDKLLTEEKGKTPFLVIAPTSLLSNWQHELQKFTPHLKFQIYHGQKRKLDLENVDIVLTSYGLLRAENGKNKEFKNEWRGVILDEAQNLKNFSTLQSKAIHRLSSPIRIAMTGTPVENSLSEFWSIFQFLNPGYLSTQADFRRKYQKPIENQRDVEAATIFKNMTAPFVLRRLKSDKSIISDLPDKIVLDQYLNLTTAQTSLYQSVVERNLKELETSEGIARKGLVLKMITELKQVCNHPVHYLKKAGMKDLKSDESGKSQYLLELLQNILDNNQKVLIFTQFKEMGDLLVQMIEEEFSLKPDFLHGGVDRLTRQEMVNNFQDKIQKNILILTLKAGGVGLNLTAATHVIHYDLWWNPAVESQATDRAYRIGQTQNVNVYRLITTGTFEEKINQMIQSKQELSNLTVSTGEKWIGELNNQELQEMFELQR